MAEPSASAEDAEHRGNRRSRSAATTCSRLCVVFFSTYWHHKMAGTTSCTVTVFLVASNGDITGLLSDVKRPEFTPAPPPVTATPSPMKSKNPCGNPLLPLSIF